MEKNKALMGVIIALLVLLLATIAFLGISFKNYMENSSAGTTQQYVSTGVASLDPASIEIISLEKSITTNLATGADGVPHMASISFSVGVNNTDKKESPKVIELVVSKESIIRDICIDAVRSKSYEELKRTDGRNALRQEILARVQEEFKSNLIYQVYVDDIILVD